MESEILSQIESAQTAADAERIIERHYPNWLVISVDKYSEDYPHLQRNWETLCQQFKTKPKKIVLVNEIVFEETPTTLNKICDFMTKNGYVVRRSNEFIACSVCEKAIPCIEIWNILKEKNFPVPRNWSDKCQSCSQSSD